jgi:hypothetical protein
MCIQQCVNAMMHSGRMMQMSGSGITTSALNWYSGPGKLIATDVDKTEARNASFSWACGFAIR